ncbi:MAG: DUF2804 domain-containing protein [Treponema sp.]|nr:DUF2804 domain-containing protein [Treponema sp.]
MPQTEITEPVSVLDETGKPGNFGWARSPLLIYDPIQMRVPRYRISEGDRYILLAPNHTVVFEILDDGYLGYLLISLLSLKDKKRSTERYMTPFSLGRFDLPNYSESGSIKFTHKKTLLNFAAMEGGARIIKVDIPKFSRGRSLRGEVVLSPPEGAESLVTNMPWRGKGEAFSYSRHSPCYFAEGVIQLGTKEIIFTRGNGWGVFDWSRGVRPRMDLCLWAAGCGQAGEHQVGFNVGYNLADSAQGTENGFFLDGKLHKLDQVSFHIPLGKLLPWRFTSNDNRLEMIFTPNQERDENHQMFFYSLKRRQLFGSFSGRAILDNGSEFVFENIGGMAERRRSRL